MSLTNFTFVLSLPRLFGRDALMGRAGAKRVHFAPARNSAGNQVLVVAIGALIAPEGRGMYFSAVVLPWYRLVAT